MALYKAYGSRLIDSRTMMQIMVDRGGTGSDATETDEPGAGVAFDLSGEPVPFAPIGINKPLAIEIRHVYTGQYPRSILGIGDGLLVSSAVKSVSTFNAAPRAVNFLRASVKRQSNIRNSSATEEGTPLVFYTPALVEASSLITFEFVFDEFPKQLVESISHTFSSAAGIPIFAQYSPIMIAAGTAVSLMGRLGEKLVDGKPVFSVTESISFLRPGDNAPQEGFHLLTQDEFDIQAADCEFDAAKGELVNISDGRSYDGPYPYLVISLDGRENDAYADFLPTAASAALLERFYHLGAGQEQALDTVIEAVKLYNDWQFRQRAERLSSRLEEIAEESGVESDAYARTKAQYDAFVTNILNEALKPP